MGGDEGRAKFGMCQRTQAGLGSAGLQRGSEHVGGQQRWKSNGRAGGSGWALVEDAIADIKLEPVRDSWSSDGKGSGRGNTERAGHVTRVRSRATGCPGDASTW